MTSLGLMIGEPMIADGESVLGDGCERMLAFEGRRTAVLLAGRAKLWLPFGNWVSEDGLRAFSCGELDRGRRARLSVETRGVRVREGGAVSACATARWLGSRLVRDDGPGTGPGGAAA